MNAVIIMKIRFKIEQDYLGDVGGMNHQVIIKE